MQIEHFDLYKILKPFKLEMPFGKYYFFEKFIISEMYNGIQFDWDMAEKLIPEILKFYGKNAKIGFISNRVNHYSVDPQNWIKLEKEYTFVAATAIVAYDKPNYMNASIEKHFSNRSIKRCNTLTEAVKWILSLDEFK